MVGGQEKGFKEAWKIWFISLKEVENMNSRG